MTRGPWQAIRRHPFRAVWLLLQFVVVGFGEWATRFGGADYHLGLLLLPVMAILLFPGIVLPLLTVGAVSAIVEAIVGHPVYLPNGPITLVLTLVVWVTSAMLTDVAWRKLWARFFTPDEATVLRIEARS